MGAVRPAIEAATGFFTLAFGVTHATFMSQLPTTPAGAFHSTSSELSHSRYRECARAPLSRNDFCFVERYRNTGRGSWPTWKQGGGELPAFVLDEFEAYFRCGIPVHSFLRVRCKDCGHSVVVAFACKRRGFW